MNSNYKVGIYLRLSKEDEKKEESNSITSQREIITNYANQNNLNIIDEYIDDGFTGTNFNRIGFKRLIKDIKKKRINMVIVKDLSRLGRDHIEFGTYVEKFFPENNIRLVAIGDMYDSSSLEKNNTTMILFKSMYNEMYVKDISDKIKMSISTKRKMGQFLGAVAPYGYVKDKLDYHKLVIDEYSASVVKKIFNLFLKGNSISSICRTLTNKKIPIPSIYKNLNRGLKSTCYGEWTNRTVTDILTNPTYIGNLTQGKLRKVNYKSKKIIHTKKEDWIIVENSCPKIIEENVFNQVQNIFNCNKNKTRKTQDILLKGLVRCKECNHTIGFRKQKIIRKKDTVYKIYGNCNYYLKHRYSNICTPHNIKYEELENIITKVIDVIINNIDKEKLKAKLDKYLNKKNDNYDNSNKIKKIKKEIDNNLKKIDKVYLDKIDNIIDNKMYERIYNTIMDINKRNEEEIKLLMKKDNSNKNINSKELINKYIKINKNLLCTIIDYINIDKDKNIEIYFNYLN